MLFHLRHLHLFHHNSQRGLLFCLLMLLTLGSQRPCIAQASDALGELQTKLESTQKRTRRSALRGLLELDSMPAWELLVGALEDPTGEVADGAQWLLGALDTPLELELILGRRGLHSKSAWVRRRVAELLGRVQTPVPPGALLEALKDRDAEVRRMAAWSLERLLEDGRWVAGLEPEASRDLLTKLRSRAGTDRESGVRGRALRALAKLEPGAALLLHPVVLRDRDLGQRCVALGLASQLLPQEEALALLSKAAHDKERLLRGQAQESLASWGTKPAIAALIECLPAETDARLRFNLVRRLRAMSGFLHREDARPWRAWLAEQGPGWKAPLHDPPGWEERGQAAEQSSSALSFSGLTLRSKRLTFLIDLSGSMWTPGADDRTAKQVVEKKLEEALESLSKDTSFNLIPYTENPHPWEKSLMPATPRNKQRASEFFAKCKERGSGNFWDAAMLALEDPEVDTLVVLSDGAPSGGKRYELELIVSHFLELNLTRRVAVDSVLVDASSHLQRYWRRLAEGTGGESISVAFP